MALYGAAKAPALTKNSDGSTVGALTEDGSAIGGTNDGDLPDLSANLSSDLTENSTDIGGTQDGNVATLSVAWDGSTNPTSAEGDLLIDGIREAFVAINSLRADMVALRAAVRENAQHLNDLIDHLNDGRS